jgi:hypothetical protein
MMKSSLPKVNSNAFSMILLKSLINLIPDSNVDCDIEGLEELQQGSGSDSGNEIETSDTDQDSATTTGDSSIINTIVAGKEEWCSGGLGQ